MSMINRRSFSKVALAIGTGLSIPLFNARPKPKKILILGGTRFVGPAIVKALTENHDVTLFNRGISNPHLFSGLSFIEGDRDLGIAAYSPLYKHTWDYVIDVWPEKADLVRDATQALTAHCKHYLFISSIAVYNDFNQVGLHESSEVVALPESEDHYHYPQEKVAAENQVRLKFPHNHTIVRAGPIKGWRDPALDLVYWLSKMKTQSEILAPGSGSDYLQLIDVKDVGAFVKHALLHKLQGTFNCTGPATPLTWSAFLNQVKTAFNLKTHIRWAEESFLREHQVASFSDLPLWAPVSEDRGFMQIDNKKITETGFIFRPLEATLSDALDWYHENWDGPVVFGSQAVNIGLSIDREKELLSLL